MNGQPYSIQTSEFEETIKGRGKRTAIGAGGGAGTAGTAFTGKRDITVPAETRLHFKLTAPLTVQPPTK